MTTQHSTTSRSVRCSHPQYITQNIACNQEVSVVNLKHLSTFRNIYVHFANCAQIGRLEKLVKERLHYDYSQVTLNNIENPQVALNHAVDNHIATHDGTKTLLLIFYTGHGKMRQSDKRFQLYAGPFSTREGRYEATAFWDEAEAPLFGCAIKSDILVMFDCCFAGAAQKGYLERKRIYELLAACPSLETTPAPGPTSFTNILIDCIECLLSEQENPSFTTTKLREKILQHPARSARSHPVLCDQLYKYDHPMERHVQISPLQKLAESSEMGALQPVSRPGINVAILMVMWDIRHSQQDLRTSARDRSHIQQLRSMFTNKYGYSCNSTQITDQRNPQTQLNLAILHHVHQYDGPDHMLVVLYIGHSHVIEVDGFERILLSPYVHHVDTLNVFTE